MDLFRGKSLIVWVLVLISCSIQLVSAMFLNESNNEPNHVSCYKNNGETAMIDNVPNPLDCNRFYACTIQVSGESMPMLLECQKGHDGNLLYYDFRSCWCEVKEVAHCYDDSLEADRNDFFTCAREAQPSDFPPLA